MPPLPPLKENREPSPGMGCLLVIFLLAPFLLDGCLNRDPNSYVDQNYRLGASWKGAPLVLAYRGPYVGEAGSFRYPPQIQKVTDLLVGDRVITGKSDERFFIVDRSDHRQLFFEARNERDEALAKSFATVPANLRPLDGMADWKANFLYPFNLIYYALAFVGLVIRSFYPSWRRMRVRRERERG